ncbi:His-Xaa-Ser system radical SAM maturase HxsC [Vibrio mediterranei]|jgi:His-Xaa-Ser system radical SAM maturase HxsC|uniref:His-Xaa-Ser system radical SAM maturase HxsC n=1 Tax=Vibrio mediterranei TaxID=689 RepID=UPI00148E24A0|nr:His-Xaa-Ser system radical SAM maturase HxsC [Vibrio mediterranei]NOI25741.1 His-Xaa-Ser system radical SAM maturase HxsC [Vibrio mediterranei]
MSDVIRDDTFLLADNSFTSPGFYQLRKTDREISNTYLEQVIVTKENESTSVCTSSSSFIGMISNTLLYSSVEDGDIATINQFGQLRVILSRRANHNTLLVTERCNNLCMFCSQPPREGKDDWLLSYGALALAAFGFDGEIGISGGEPLLYGNEFIDFLVFLSDHAPNTRLHILTNGRAFSDLEFTLKLASKINRMDVTFGIPLYSSKVSVHDYLVGNNGAFSETVTGMINAGNSGLKMEIRFIPTQHNAIEFPLVAEYVSRIFSNVVQLSVMNLEATGWAKRNWEYLQCDVETYKNALIEGLQVAASAGLNPTLFNFPLCHLPKETRNYAVKSISDWKNYYPNECNTCQLKESCGGYFSSSRGKYHKHPRRII